MTHRYNTRFQAAQVKKNKVNQAIDHKNDLADRVSKVNSYGERLERIITLYEYVRDTPILMESVNGFREDVWEKLNLLEELLFEKSQKLDPFHSSDGTIEFLIRVAMTLIDEIRAKYW
jgi:uncharacterized protein YoxC